MRAYFQRNAAASALTISVLARPGTPTSRACEPVKRTDQQLVDHLVLADDDFVQGRADRPHAIGEGVYLLSGRIDFVGDACHELLPWCKSSPH